MHRVGIITIRRASLWNQYLSYLTDIISSFCSLAPGIPVYLARCACCARRARRARLSAHMRPLTTVASVFKVAAFFQACGRGAAAGQLSRRERCRPRYGVLTVSVPRGDEEGGERDRIEVDRGAIRRGKEDGRRSMGRRKRRRERGEYERGKTVYPWLGSWEPYAHLV